MAAKKQKIEEVTAKTKNFPIIEPVMVASCDIDTTSSTRTRRNATTSIIPTDQYANIKSGLTPFRKNNNSHYTIKDAIELCQKAYYNISSLRNLIDIMGDFSVGEIHLDGKNDEAKKFFTAWLKKIKIADIQDKYYRERYRSGNIFFAKLFSDLEGDFIRKISQVYSLAKKDSFRIPLKYVILNAADIEVGGISSDSSLFYKSLNLYEIERLRNPTTEDEIRIFKGLPEDIKKQIKSGSTSVLIPLDSKDIIISFYKKQDYEPLAIPLAYGILRDLNFKEELKKVDLSISRTVQQAVLHIAVGFEQKGGELYIDQKQIEAYRNLFQNESISKVLITDFATKLEWHIPQISDILDPKKYTIVDKDIANSLSNILTGGAEEKFANRSIGVRIFIERLKEGRNAFLNDFLIPEIRSVAKELGFKNYPTPYYEDFDLQDDLEYLKIYTRLVELGVLTPEESFEAFETGKLPTKQTSLESQKEYKDQRKEGLYQPMVGSAYYQGLFAPKPQVAGPSKSGGRPGGTSAPKKVTPIGGSYSSSLLIDNMKLLGELNKEVEKESLKFYKIKKLTKEQKEIIIEIANTIVVNEEPKDWLSKAKEYVENPADKNLERVNKVQEIAAEFGIDYFMAGLLKSSEKKIDF